VLWVIDCIVTVSFGVGLCCGFCKLFWDVWMCVSVGFAMCGVCMCGFCDVWCVYVWVL